MIPHLLDTSLSFSSQITDSDMIYIIEGDFNLGNVSVNNIGNNCVLRFNGGKISNGKLRGNNTRIDNSSDRVIFESVELEYEEIPANNAPITGWLGECKDIWFSYSEATKAHFKIVKSVCQFETCLFSRRTYYIEQWARIPLRCFGCEIKGETTTFILPGNKGQLSLEPGFGNRPQYATPCLFEKGCVNYFPGYNNGERAGRFIVSGLTILDNDEVIQEQGWGECMSDFGIEVNPPNPQSTVGFTYYRIFSGSGNHVEFRDVIYDGCGGLWPDYNHYTHIHQFLIEDCSIKCAQFAFEMRTKSGEASICGGYCDALRICRCLFYNYAGNLLVGPLSFVSNELGYTIKHLLVENCVFDSEKEANLELSGCEYIDIRNNTFLSVQCSSDHPTSNEGYVHINKLTTIFGNRFNVSDSLSSAGAGLSICSGDLSFRHNEVVLDYSRLSSGGFSIRGFGNDVAFISGNTFVLKRTDVPGFKTMIVYQGITPSLIGNQYVFTDGIVPGGEVHIVGDCDYLHLEIDNDPRFAFLNGNGYKDWQSIPSNKITPEGLLVKGETLNLDSSFTASSSFEFDFKAFVDGQTKDGVSNLFSFLAMSENKSGNNYRVFVQSYDGKLRISVPSAGINTLFPSSPAVFLSLPDLGFDSNGKESGYLRFAFLNESASGITRTRVNLFINDYQVDSILIDIDVLSQGISSIQLYGSSYLRIMKYRIHRYCRFVNHPIVNAGITSGGHDGYQVSGPTTQRPSFVDTGFVFFDTTLGKPVFYTGTGWVDATGLSQ